MAAPQPHSPPPSSPPNAKISTSWPMEPVFSPNHPIGATRSRITLAQTAPPASSDSKDWKTEPVSDALQHAPHAPSTPPTSSVPPAPQDPSSTKINLTAPAVLETAKPVLTAPLAPSANLASITIHPSQEHSAALAQPNAFNAQKTYHDHLFKRDALNATQDTTSAPPQPASCVPPDVLPAKPQEMAAPPAALDSSRWYSFLITLGKWMRIISPGQLYGF
jgi:hypothetical protein